VPETSQAGSAELPDVDHAELRAEVARMRDRERIVELHDRYAAILDADDFDALASLFTDDAMLEGFPGGPVTGASTIARWLGDISTHHVASQRMITNHRIALSGDRARVVVAFRSAHLDKADSGEADGGEADGGAGSGEDGSGEDGRGERDGGGEADGGGHRAHTHEGWYLSDLARSPDGWRFDRLKRVNLADLVNGSATERRTVRDEVYRYASAPPSDG
jgi:ketosteroid isomerase-like protein